MSPLPPPPASSLPSLTILTSEVLDANKTAYRHQRVMIKVQERDLILFLSQYEEHGVEQLGDFAHVVQPYGSGHLENEEQINLHFERKKLRCVSGFFHQTWPMDKTRFRLRVWKSGLKTLFSQIVDSFQIMNKIIIWSANAAIHVRVCFRFEYLPELRSDCCCNPLVGNENCNTFSIPIRDPIKFKKYHVKSKNKFCHEIYWFYFFCLAFH